jgi:hypothetical protein
MRPVTTPTTTPSSSTVATGSSRLVATAAVRAGRSMAIAVAAIMSANSIIRTWPDRCAARRPPRNAPAMPPPPNRSPVRHFTRPARACGMSAAPLVTATTNSDEAIAAFGDMPAM